MFLSFLLLFSSYFFLLTSSFLSYFLFIYSFFYSSMSLEINKLEQMTRSCKKYQLFQFVLPVKMSTSGGSGECPVNESLKAFIHSFIQPTLIEYQPLCGDCKGKHCPVCLLTLNIVLQLHFRHQMCGFSTLQAILQHQLGVLQFNSIYLESYNLHRDWIRSHRLRVQSY